VNWNQMYQMKFGLSIMEHLDGLRTEILVEVEKGGSIRDETRRETSQVIALMNTAGDAISNDILRIMADKLQDALEPQYPYNFIDTNLIDKRFSNYKKAFRRAISKHNQVWDSQYQNLARMMLSQRPEDAKKDLTLPEKFKEWFKKK